MFGIMNVDASNEDWKTAMAHNQRSLKKGEKVEIINRDFQNFYGSYYQVQALDGERFYVKQSYVTICK